MDDFIPKKLNIVLSFCVALCFTAGCSGGSSAKPQEKGSRERLAECPSYERELRACSAAVGAPPVAADTFAATLAKSDEAARLRMEGACARDRARLRASCK